MLRHAPRGHCGSSVGSRKANEERLPTTGVGDRSQIVCLGRASWSAGAGCCVFVLLFLAAMRIRRRGIWQWHGEKLWQVAWRVFCFVCPRQWVCVHVLGGAPGFSSASGQRPIRLGPAPVCVWACLGMARVVLFVLDDLLRQIHSTWVEDFIEHSQSLCDGLIACDSRPYG